MNCRAIVRLIVDDGGQDLIEYALLIGTISAGSLLSVFVLTLLMRIQFVNSQIGTQAVWEPCPPSPGACP